MGTGVSMQTGEYTTRVFEGKEVVFDEEGFILNPESWTETISEVLAEESGLSRLTELHWATIHFLRTFYLANGRAPLNRDIRRETGLNLLEVERLFPGGIRHGARRLAGLPNPKSC
jgi:dissimilatory sulfite reductase related protein